MRKLKLFMTALALVGGVNFAQADDVTGTYLTNAGFDDCTAETSDVAAKTIKDYSTNGWTNTKSGEFTTIAVTSYGSDVKVGGSTTPSTKKDGTTVSGNTLGIIAGWGDEVIIESGEITLPAGVYTLTVDHYLTSTTSNYNNTSSNFGFVTSANSYLVSSTPFTASTWTTETVTFTLTESTPGKIQIGLKGLNKSGSGSPAIFYDDVTITWTDLLQGAKDALQAEIDKAKLCDAKEGLADAIAAAENALTNATTVAELEAALATLQAADKDAVLRYENGLADATYSTPIVTSFVVNGTFDNGINPWQRTGSFQNNKTANNKQGAFTGNFYENWNGSAQINKMYQTINDVPNGTYRLDIAAFVNTLADPNESQYVFANNDKTYLTTGDPTAYEVYTVVTNNKIEVGLEQTTATANWMGIDNVSLRYYGAGDVVNDAKNASHKLAWEEAKAAAEAAITNTDYANVTGSEKTALQAEIAKAEPSTADGYDEAAAALNTATAAFTAAKANYDIFVTYNVDLTYADASKKPAITSESTAASIITALRAYYESNALAEGVENALNMTDRIANPNAEDGNNSWTWTGSKNNPASNEPWTDADGTNTHTYFDGGNWNGSNWTTTMKQTISLPAGKYLLTAKGRAATNTTLTMAVGEASVNLPNVGNAGNVFDRGWGDGSVEFITDGSDVEILVTATAEPTHEWFSISQFRLVRLELYTEMANAADYEAMATALAAAKAKTLGFATGEYAPYNNVEAITAITTAEAIDTDAENAKADIEAITTALGNWTANTEEVNAFYDGTFAIQEEHTTGPTALAGWNNPEGIRQLIKNTETYPGLNSATDKAAVFAWGGTTMTYGNTEGYTMPLAAHTIYELTFKTCGWKDGDMGYVSVTVKNSSDEGLGDTHSVTATKRITEENPWDEFKVYFETGEAGNYTFGMWTSKHTTFTDLMLKKAVAEDVTISEAATAAPEYNYANVTLTRTLSKDYWNTFSVPFDAPIPEGWTVKEFDSADDNTLNFKAAESIKAGVPYLVKPEADVENPTFNGVVVKATEGETKGEGDYKFAAQIYNKDLATDGTIAYLATDGSVMKLTSGGIKGLRAYFIVPLNGAAARIAFIDDGGTTTGIESMESAAQKVENGVYDMQGRRVEAMKKGLYIVNGKKVVK